MKKLLFLFLFLPLLAFTQVPQGVGYQGVATDAYGIELVNQSISIRASIISASTTGTIEWQETHTTSTDTFGLFTLTIGQGTSTGNGAQTSFADISWGANIHFLKIEMDVNGGTNYSHMGTNQMMSVPYALYAENANIDYDSISTLLSNDSTFITTVSGGIGGGCNPNFPDGYNNLDPISWSLISSNSYTVPSGKNLYIVSATGNGSYGIFVNGLEIHYGNELNDENFLIFEEGDVLTNGANGSSYYLNFNGYLVDKIVDPISWSLSSSNSYTVPSGKNLYIVSATGNGSYGIFVNGLEIHYGNELNDENFLIFEEGDVLTNGANGSSYYLNFNGYLVDEDYFADCGGGGSSSSGGGSSSNDDWLGDFSSDSSSDFSCDYISEIPQDLDGMKIILFSTDKTIYLTDSVGSFLTPVYSLDNDYLGCLTSNEVGDTLYFLQVSDQSSPPVIMMMTTNNLTPTVVGSVPQQYNYIRQFKYFNGDFYYLEGNNGALMKISNGNVSLVDNSSNYSHTVSNNGTVHRGYYQGGNYFLSGTSYFSPQTIYDLDYSELEDRMYMFQSFGGGRISYWDYSNTSFTTLFDANSFYLSSSDYMEQVVRYDDGFLFFNLAKTLFSIENDGSNLRIIASSVDDSEITGIVSLSFQYQNNNTITNEINISNFILSSKKKIFFSTDKTIYLTDSVGSFLTPVYSLDNDYLGCLTSNEVGDTLYFLQVSDQSSPPVIMMMTTNNLTPTVVGSVPQQYNYIRQFKYFNGDFYYLEGNNGALMKISNGNVSLVDNSSNYSHTVSNNGTVHRGYYQGGNYFLSGTSYFSPQTIYDLDYSELEDRMYMFQSFGGGRISYWDYSNTSFTTLFDANSFYLSSSDYMEQVVRYDDGFLFFNLAKTLFSIENDGSNLRIIASSVDDSEITGIVIFY